MGCKEEINPEWQEKVKMTYRHRRVVEEVVNSLKAAQWLIEWLANRRIGFKVINLGAGVRRITTYTEVCPKCNGTGRC